MLIFPFAIVAEISFSLYIGLFEWLNIPWMADVVQIIGWICTAVLIAAFALRYKMKKSEEAALGIQIEPSEEFKRFARMGSRLFPALAIVLWIVFVALVVSFIEILLVGRVSIGDVLWTIAMLAMAIGASYGFCACRKWKKEHEK